MVIRSNRLPLALHAGRPFMASNTAAACCTVQTRPSPCGFVVSASVIRVGVQCSGGSNGGPVVIKLEDDHQVALTAFDELKQNHPHGGGSGRRRRQPSPAPNKTLIWSGGERTGQTNSKPKTTERAAKLNLGRRVRLFFQNKIELGVRPIASSRDDMCGPLSPWARPTDRPNT
jgi:hypothetical protein